MPMSLPRTHLECFPVEIGTTDVSFWRGFNDYRGCRIELTEEHPECPQENWITHDAVDIGSVDPVIARCPVWAFVVKSRRARNSETGLREESAGVGCSKKAGNYITLIDYAGFIHYFSHLDEPGSRHGLVSSGDMLVTPYWRFGSVKGLHYQVFGPVDTHSAEWSSRTITRAYASVDPYDALEWWAIRLNAEPLNDGKGTYKIHAGTVDPI